MMNFSRKKIIIVGGNAAGPAAAAKAKRVDPAAEVILFESSEFISTGTCEMPYVLSGEIDDYRKIIFYDQEKFKQEKNVQVYTKHLVESIDARKKTISVLNFNDGSRYNFEYDKLILATGSLVKNYPELNLSLSNVFSFKNVNDLINLKLFIEKNKPHRAVVIGAGYIGLEVAEALSSLGLNVFVIEKSEFPFPESEIEIQKLTLQTLNDHNIDFIGGYKKISFIENEKSTTINIDGRLIETDLIVKCIGVQPNNKLAHVVKLTLGNYGGLVVNQRLQTSDQNIFAAGDCIEVTDKILNQRSFIPVATLAHLQGHTAGANAAGGNAIYPPVIKNVAIKFFQNTIALVGISSMQAFNAKFRFKEYSAVAKNLIKVMPESRSVFGKLIVDVNTKMILGAAFFGGSEVVGYADLISTLIANKVSAEKLKDFQYNYTPPRSPFINLLSILGRKIMENKNE